MPKAAEEMRERIVRQLRKAHPNWSEKKIESTSYSIVQAHYKSLGKKLPF